MSTPLKLEFVATFAGERDTGLMPYTEVITLTIESGDPGGEPNEFVGQFQDFLKEWFDGASVEPKAVFDENIRRENEMYEQMEENERALKLKTGVCNKCGVIEKESAGCQHASCGGIFVSIPHKFRMDPMT